MSPFDLDNLLAGLESCRRRLRDVQPRFAESPAHAVGYFLEGPGDLVDLALHSADTAANFLDLPAGRVALAQLPDRACDFMRLQSGFYCLYLPDDGAVATTDAPAALARQRSALRPIFDALTQTLNAARDNDADGRLPPAWRLSWWEALFHLAVHFPTTFLRATRERWGEDARGPAGPVRRAESLLQFDRDRAFRDVVPGVIWVQLRGDVWTSTERAIEDLITHLTRADPLEAGLDALTELYTAFNDISKSEQSMIYHKGGADFSNYAAQAKAERLVKVSSTFETGPVPQWCDFNFGFGFTNLLLARYNAEAEYFLYRGSGAEDQGLWAAAGAMLSPANHDSDLMFATPEWTQPWAGGAVRGQSCEPAFLNPDPKARWVRFVFNIFNDFGIQVRWSDTPAGPVYTVDYARGTTPTLARWRDTPTGPAGTGWPIYGDASLPCDFDTASAIVVKHMMELREQAADEQGDNDDGDEPLPTAKSDGPFEPFGFRYRGREVDFAAAPLRHALLSALWDAGAEKPFESRTTEQILDLVYPDDEDAEAKLKNLKVETNRALLRAEVPLAIKSASAKHWLKPSP